MTYQNPFFRVPAHGKREDSPESLKGYLLISENHMLDPNFSETVVLILEHNHEGAFGLVVNRRSRLCLHDISSQFSKIPESILHIHMGGPVQQEYLFVLHSEMPEGHESSPEALRPVEGVIFEPSFSHVEKYFDDAYWGSLSLPPDDYPKMHLYLGYSGWGPGQLEDEMQAGSWIFHPAQADIVFHNNPEQGWREALRAKGGIYKIFANSKQDPSLN